METIERRVPWLTVSLAILLAYDSVGAGLAFSGVSTWRLVVYLVGIIGLAVAAVLLVCSLAPDWFIRPFSIEQRERFAFFAFVLLAVAVVAIVILSAHGAIEAHRHPNG